MAVEVDPLYGVSNLAQPMWCFFDASQRQIASTTVPRDYLETQKIVAALPKAGYFINSLT